MDDELIMRRKADPASCLREPNADEVKVPLSDFDWLAEASGWDKRLYYFGERVKARHRGFNNIVMPKADYEEALSFKNKK